MRIGNEPHDLPCGLACPHRFGVRPRMWSKPCLMAAKRASTIGVGEDVGQILFDAFADELADIEWVYALRDAFPDHLGHFGERARRRHGLEPLCEAPEEIASGVHDLGADEPRAQHRYADPARREFTPQALGQRHDAILGDVVGVAAARDQAGDRGRRDDVPGPKSSIPQMVAIRLTPSVQFHDASLQVP